MNCAGRHGPARTGNGPYTRYLNVRVPNLSTLSRRNKGEFPAARVYATIDGRQEVKGHGAPNMPVWGADHLAQGNAAAPVAGGESGDRKAFVRSRITGLVDYVRRVQVK